MPWHALEMLPQCGNIRFFFAQPTKSRNLWAKAHALWAFRGLSRGAANLLMPMGNLINTGSTHVVHSHRAKPSFHSISVMCRFWVCLFDTRSAHQNARWSKCPTHDHKHRVNPFNVAGSAQPRFINGFRISKRFFFFCAAARPQGGKIVTFLFDLLKRVLNRGWADSRM